MKTKSHKFVVTVKTTSTKASARNAVLCAFARRNPDGCEFILKELRQRKVPVPLTRFFNVTGVKSGRSACDSPNGRF